MDTKSITAVLPVAICSLGSTEDDDYTIIQPKADSDSKSSVGSSLLEDDFSQQIFVSGDDSLIIGSIEGLLNSIGPLSDSIARAYFLKILDALATLHGMGMDHGNLSIETVFLTDNFEPRLGGLELKFLSPGLPLPHKGTFQKNQSENFNRDIFDLGVLLFCMVSGFTPFEAMDEEDHCFKAFSEGDMELFWKIEEAKWHESTGIVQHQKFREPFRALVEDLLAAMSKKLDARAINTHRWCQNMTIPFYKTEGIIIEILKKKGIAW